MIPGGLSGGETPVPISNTEVKPSSADGTTRKSVWESRSLPGFFIACDLLSKRGFRGKRIFPLSAQFSFQRKEEKY